MELLYHLRCTTVKKLIPFKSYQWIDRIDKVESAFIFYNSLNFFRLQVLYLIWLNL